jgi:hypothetical protein
MNKDEMVRYVRGWELDKDDEECERKWKLLGTLTFPGMPSWSNTRRRFYRWMAKMREYGAPQFLNWIAVFEHSRFDATRIYILLGSSQIGSQQRWVVRWHELSRGDATLDRYRRGGFHKHVLQEARPNRYFVVAIDLCGWGLYEDDQV